ncbi:Cation transport protein, partial [Gilliamella apicola SCGC AB-598-I20]
SYLIVKIENKIQLKNIITNFIRNINSNCFTVVFCSEFLWLASSRKILKFNADMVNPLL